jgi:hypothetical protein
VWINIIGLLSYIWKMSIYTGRETFSFVFKWFALRTWPADTVKAYITAEQGQKGKKNEMS